MCVYIFDLQIFFSATQGAAKAIEADFQIKSATNVDLTVLADKVIRPSAVCKSHTGSTMMPRFLIWRLNDSSPLNLLKNVRSDGEVVL